MEKKIKILALTDHKAHHSSNSIYVLLKAINRHPQCGGIEVASRGNAANRAFFYENTLTPLQAVTVTENFHWQTEGHQFIENTKTVQLADYDVLLMRVPRPIPDGFFAFLEANFPKNFIINRPSGIDETSNKAFLLNFPEVCPPMKLCKSIDDIEEFRQQFAIVLKPLENYGGRGIIKIEGDTASEGKEEIPYEQFVEKLKGQDFVYLGMKFLKNVSEGDKRLIVAGGKLVGASLRKPAPGSWLANISQGGTPHRTKPDDEERRIAEVINPTLWEKGIVLYGFDTLVNDDGKRILSEINTLSIGGIMNAGLQSPRPVADMAADAIWRYVFDQL